MQNEFVKRDKKSINPFLFWGIFVAVILIACVVLQVTGQFKNLWAEILYRQAQQAHNDENLPKVAEMLSRVVALKPDRAIAQYELGVAYIDINNKDKAEKQIEVLRQLKQDDLAQQLEKLTMENKYHVVRGADHLENPEP